MKTTQNDYNEMVKKRVPPSNVLRDCACAFVVGGLICTLGQGLRQLYTHLGADKDTASIAVTLSLIGLSILLTAIGVYDDVAKRAGAGTLVPITGFANSVASPALEFKSEGFVLGLGAKMFTIAGPVIVYGTVASVVYGIIYWITTLF